MGEHGSSRFDFQKEERNLVFPGRDLSIELSESSESSYLCESTDSLPEWSQYIDANGSVFYLEHYEGQETSCEPHNTQQEPEGDKGKSNNLGLFVRLIRRRNSRRSLKRVDGDAKPQIAKQSPLSIFPKGQDLSGVYEVQIKLDKRLGDSVRSTSFLRELGLVLKPHKHNLAVQEITPHSSCSFKSEICKGDYLISINDSPVSIECINDVLKSLPSTQQVQLKFSKPFSTQNPKINSINANMESEAGSPDLDSVAIVYCTLEGQDESFSPTEGIVYSFPSNSNTVSTLIGLFLTLNHLLSTISSKDPIRTNLTSNGKEYIIFYSVEESQGVLLVALPHSIFNETNGAFVVSHLKNYLLFNYQTLSTCFKAREHRPKLDEFFNNFFPNSLKAEEVQEFFKKVAYPMTPTAHFLPLPHEAYVQLDDALNELESNNMEVYESQRLYSIIGSCYFHRGFLLCSHLAKDDLVEVSSLCHHFSLLLESKLSVKQLVFWKEVFPSSVGRGLSPPSNRAYTPQPGRFFLLIVGKGDALLPVLFKSSFWPCNEGDWNKLGPNIFYVEEAEATLSHIERIGIPSYVNKWLGLNPAPPASKPNKFELSTNVSQMYDIPSSNSSVSVEGDFPSSLEGSVGGPVLGRRAERERLIEPSTLSKVSGSDFSDDSDLAKDSKLFRRNEFMELSDSPFDSLAPTCLSENATVYYLHAGSFYGAFISSHKTHPVRHELFSQFFSSCHQIHNIFTSTIVFKKLKVQEVSTSIINKSLIAIKEHGLAFSLEVPGPTGKSSLTENYWVVGRLFSSPVIKEVYVCHLDSCPLSLVEMTFRLTLNTLL